MNDRMSLFSKRYFVFFLIVLFSLVCSESAKADEGGFFRRMWGRITSIRDDAPPVEAEPEDTSPAEAPRVEQPRDLPPAPPVRGPDPAPGPARAEDTERPQRDAEHMKEVIKRRLQIFPEISELVSGLRIVEDEPHFETADGEVFPIDELDEETLNALFVRVNQHATRLNTERINRQIQQIQQHQRLLRQQTPPRVPQRPPETPRRAPQPPPRVPQTPRQR